MAIENKSENKVRVSNLFGTEAIIGWMDPIVDLRVGWGIETRWIVGLDSGNFQVSLAFASGGAVIAKTYPDQLVVSPADASGQGWPNAVGCVNFTHEAGVLASGSPKATSNNAVFLKGDGTMNTFTRG